MPSSPFECVICKKLITNEYANNPYPISSIGKCCDKCNLLVVIERMKLPGC